jgi:hypothetical protein
MENEDSDLGYDTASMCKWNPTFQGYTMPSFSRKNVLEVSHDLRALILYQNLHLGTEENHKKVMTAVNPAKIKITHLSNISLHIHQSCQVMPCTMNYNREREHIMSWRNYS